MTWLHADPLVYHKLIDAQEKSHFFFGREELLSFAFQYCLAGCCTAQDVCLLNNVFNSYQE